MAYLPNPSADEDAKLGAFLADIARRKEFAAFRGWAPRPSADVRASLQIPAFYAPDPSGAGVPLLPGLQLHGAQRFAENFGSPDTPYLRLVLNWQTGTGKSIAIIALALRHAAEYRARVGTPPAERPTAFIIGFTRSIIQAEMLRHPEFGFASRAEIAETQRLHALATRAGPKSPEARQHAAHLGSLRRRITDRARGGYFQFMGYREFAGRLLRVTRRGAAAGLTLQKIFERPERPGRDDDPSTALGPGSEGDRQSGGEIVARIGQAVEAGELVVDEDLLGSLRGGFVAADEIHNTYNIQSRNNYGAALLYALDRLEAEGPGEAPRVVFATATMMTGAAAEIVDLLNLLVPRAELPGQRRLRRDEFFARPGAGAGARSVLLPGALERIGRLTAGRVSFLLDADEAAYPRRVFEGAPLRDPRPGASGEIPYLRFTPCPMSPFHARTLAHFAEQQRAARAARGAKGPARTAAAADPGTRSAVPALGVAAYTLYDMVYPNPEFGPRAAAEESGEAYGLFRAGAVARRLAGAPVEWRRAAGVEVETAAGTGDVALRGPFLAIEPAGPGSPPGLASYSTKFAAAAFLVSELIRRGPGKVLIYLDRVRGAGALQQLEILQANGLASETSAATPSTLCAVCGVAKRDHESRGRGPGEARGAQAEQLARLLGDSLPPRGPEPPAHAYTPARFLLVHSELEPAGVERALAKVNARSNLEGYEYRGLVGSRIMQEGKNLMAFRYQLILSLPDDIPTYIQLLGRVSRKGSHLALPPDQRDVRVWTFVSTGPGGPGDPGPEVHRYAEKMQEYFPIQEIDREIRRRAVDAPLRHGAMAPRLAEPSLAGLPYEPLVRPGMVEEAPPRLATFEAYGHGDREVETIIGVLRALFAVRPVWTYGDLWAAARTPGAVAGLAADPALFDEGSFALALGRLSGHNPRLWVDPPAAAAGLPAASRTEDFGVARAGEFYVLAPPPRPGGEGPGGGAVVDIESYLRDDPPPVRVRVGVAEFVRTERDSHNFRARLRKFESELARPGGAPIETTLVTYPPKFHYGLLRRLVEDGAGGASGPAGAAGAAARLYRRFRLLVTASELRAHPEAKRLGEAALTAPLAGRGAKKGLPGSALVGYVTARSVRLYAPSEPASAGERAWFEIPREALGVGLRFGENDVAVGYASPGGQLKVRPPVQELAAEEVADVRSLARGAVCRTRSREEQEDLASRLGAATRAEARGATSGELCDRILARLLEREEEARNGKNGMLEGVRWFYLLDERTPSLAVGRP